MQFLPLVFSPNSSTVFSLQALAPFTFFHSTLIRNKYFSFFHFLPCRGGPVRSCYLISIGSFLATTQPKNPPKYHFQDIVDRLHSALHEFQNCNWEKKSLIKSKSPTDNTQVVSVTCGKKGLLLFTRVEFLFATVAI